MQRRPFDLSTVRDADGNYSFDRACTEEEILLIAEEILAARVSRGCVLASPNDSRAYLRARLATREQEVFCCLFLDNRHRVLAFEELFFGTIDGTSVHPREVLRRVLAHNAAAVILAHNHPSGVTEPSRADESITRRLTEALALIDVRVLDHIVVGGAETTSFAERGLL